MEPNKTRLVNKLIQWGLFLATNILFVCKYCPRIGLNPIICAVGFGIVTTGLFLLYETKIRNYISEHIACILSIVGLCGMIAIIATAIFLIPPLSIQVDRWSATTYFLDALFDGVYPYSVHTHISETNYSSPFPLWHYFNIPFWLIGDVGWIQAFFLAVFASAVYYCFRSWRTLLSVVLLLIISPAYWWEIATRSDGLSNILLVCSAVLFIERYPLRMQNRWWLLAIIAGCIACTRMSAVVPLALYLFYPWMEANWKIKTGFLLVALTVAVCLFAPYLFWDTTDWIFFSRNPFITQTLQGNHWTLVAMIGLAILIAYKKQTFYYYLSTTSVFMFVFMLVSLLGVIYASEEDVTILDNCCDISYFTLSLPFAILAATWPDDPTP